MGIYDPTRPLKERIENLEIRLAKLENMSYNTKKLEACECGCKQIVEVETYKKSDQDKINIVLNYIKTSEDDLTRYMWAAAIVAVLMVRFIII